MYNYKASHSHTCNHEASYSYLCNLKHHIRTCAAMKHHVHVLITVHHPWPQGVCNHGDTVNNDAESLNHMSKVLREQNCMFRSLLEASNLLRMRTDSLLKDVLQEKAKSRSGFTTGSSSEWSPVSSVPAVHQAHEKLRESAMVLRVPEADAVGGRGPTYHVDSNAGTCDTRSF